MVVDKARSLPTASAGRFSAHECERRFVRQFECRVVILGLTREFSRPVIVGQRLLQHAARRQAIRPSGQQLRVVQARIAGQRFGEHLPNSPGPVSTVALVDLPCRDAGLFLLVQEQKSLQVRQIELCECNSTSAVSFLQEPA